eukprot:9359782-Alexandrium_andersonii.AAC.1
MCIRDSPVPATVSPQTPGPASAAMPAPPDAAAPVGGPSSGGVVTISPEPRPDFSASQKDKAAQRCGVDDLEIVARVAGLDVPKLAEYLQ